MTSIATSLARHVTETPYEALPPDALLHAKTFILDTLGVGIAGSTAQGAAELLAVAKLWGGAPEAPIWGRRDRLSAQGAALLNGFQVHCQEFDCVHEAAVLHPLAALLPAALAFAERAGGISGREFLVAVATGVDVSTTLGMASREKLRFFRPATAGGFGAVAAIGRLAGLDTPRLAGAFGIQYAQTSGTMQPHIEGNVVLPMQVGFNARAALQSVDLAAQGIVGPSQIFEGDCGYLRLFEGVSDLGPGLAELGRTWQISAVSHKPFPAGRAAHGAIEGLMHLHATPGFAAGQVQSVRLTAPPLISQLCARPDLPMPSGNYARLCLAFIGAKLLQHGCIKLSHYRNEALTDPRTHELAKLFTLEPDGSTDQTAMTPQELTVRMQDGSEQSWRCTELLASPQRRLSRAQHLAKFRDCCCYAAEPLTPGAIDRLIDVVDHLEDVADMRTLMQ